MSREDFLREAMSRAAAHGEPETGDAFARFQRVRSRGNFIRGLVLSTGAIGIAIALVLVLPGLGSNPNNDFINQPPIEPGLTTYVDSIAGFQFDYPRAWTLLGAPGKTVVVHPAGEYNRIATCAGCHPETTETVLQPHVTIDVMKDVAAPACKPPACAVSPSARAGTHETRSVRDVDGRAAWAEEVVWDARPPQTDANTTYWCASCHTIRIALDNWYDGRTGWSITIVLAYTEGQTGADLESARALVASFRRYRA